MGPELCSCSYLFVCLTVILVFSFCLLSEATKTLSKLDRRKAVKHSWREKAALISREDLAAVIVPYEVNCKRVRKAK